MKPAINDIMIDCETLSTRSDAEILTVAAVAFDIETGKIGKTLHMAIGGNTGGHVCANTIRWWERQPGAAFENVWQMIEKTPYHPVRAMHTLNDFIDRHPCAGIWSNGAAFDLPIIANTMRRLDIEPAWKHWHERDMRTIVDLCRQIAGVDPKKSVAFEGQAHCALHDAIYQARVVSLAYRTLKNRTAT